MAMNLLGRLEAGATLKIIMKNPPATFDLAEPVRRIKQAVQQWLQNQHQEIEVSDDTLGIVVRAFDDTKDPNPAKTGEWPDDYTKAKPSDWSIVVDSRMIPRDEVDRYRSSVRKGDAQVLGGPPRSRLFIRIESPIREIEPQLIKKLRKKLSQLSESESHPRLVLMETQGLIEKHDWEFLFAEVGTLFRKHPSFADVAYLDRRYMQDNRYHYAQFLHSNDAGGHRFSADLFEALKQFEESRVY